MHDYWRFIRAYLLIGLRTVIEYRASFLGQLIGMTINNGLWLVFWALYFQRFPIVQGWTITDLLYLWSILCTSVGLVFGFTANSLTIAEMGQQGGLDYYLTTPRPVLLHISIAKVSPFNLSDAIFGIVLFVVACHPSWSRLGAFLIAVLLVAILWYGFLVLLGALCMIAGASQGLSSQIQLFMIHFSTYPGELFGPKTRIFLLTIIPSVFISSTSVAFVRSPNWTSLLLLAFGAAIFLGLALVAFRAALRRYESGNLVTLRG
jgi:ABC-2 type transport system permease protein